MALLLFVCEGNLCRSPLSERVLKGMLGQPSAPNLVIASAGTSPALGRVMPEETASIIELLGGRSAGHTPKELQQQCLTDAALVLTATRDQRAEVIRRHPVAVRRTFTIRQLGYVLDTLGPGDPMAVGDDPLASIAERVRRNVASAAGIDGDADVVDPFGKREPVHASAAIQMLPALNLLATALGGTPLELPPSLIEAARAPKWWRRPRKHGR